MGCKIVANTFLCLILCNLTTASEHKPFIQAVLTSLEMYYDAVGQWAHECNLKTSIKSTSQDLVSLIKCLANRVSTHSTVQLVMAQLIGDHAITLRSICQSKNEVFSCFDSIFDDGFLCLNTSDEKTSWNESWQALNSSIAYICHPKEQRMSRITEPKALACLNDLDLLPCLTDNVPVKDIVKYLTNTNGIKCRKEKLIHNCLKKQLRNCREHDAHKIVTEFLDKFFKAPCNTASTFQSPSILLLVGFVTIILAKFEQF